jgi:hypothetical protein
MPSTNDPVSHHPHIRSRDEVSLSFRLATFPIRWKRIDSTLDSGVKESFRIARRGAGTPPDEPDRNVIVSN